MNGSQRACAFVVNTLAVVCSEKEQTAGLGGSKQIRGKYRKCALAVKVLIGEAVEVGVQLDGRRPNVQAQWVQLGHEVAIHLQGFSFPLCNR